MTATEQTWVEETIEHWLPEKGLVYVFRWVPDYAPYNSRRDGNHPTFEEWLDDLRGAAVGLDGPGPRVRMSYEQERIGIAGHRPMTDEERRQYADQLWKEIKHRESQFEALNLAADPARSTPTPETPTGKDAE